MKEIRGLKDKELVQGLGGICDVNIKLHDINEVIRLGKKPTQDGKPRPLKVIMKEPESKVLKTKYSRNCGNYEMPPIIIRVKYSERPNKKRKGRGKEIIR